jgi:hypothetical protein
MQTQQAHRSAWLQLFILGASALLIVIVAGNFLLFTGALPVTGRGMPLETALMLTGVAIALPLGLLNTSLGISGLKQGGAGKPIAAIGLITGLLGLLLGLLWLGSLAFLLLGGFR